MSIFTVILKNVDDGESVYTINTEAQHSDEAIANAQKDLAGQGVTALLRVLTVAIRLLPDVQHNQTLPVTEHRNAELDATPEALDTPEASETADLPQDAPDTDDSDAADALEIAAETATLVTPAAPKPSAPVKNAEVAA